MSDQCFQHCDGLEKVPVLQLSPHGRVAPPHPTQALPAVLSATQAVVAQGWPSNPIKPPHTHSPDSILALKQDLKSSPNGPPVAAQRLLLEGKALADAKSIKEHPIADIPVMLFSVYLGCVEERHRQRSSSSGITPTFKSLEPTLQTLSPASALSTPPSRSSNASKLR
ncbi:Ubiquitin-domain-containing protein [Mycena sanguinolenta]|uniref:Ubiquitin-domain-containing protein n=1 Tax=Mycena sanguinolenta TaxID=230812 RepID=A0A8H6XPW9_9AGAR|nr:Ubiquitin-domain-containing protein [Mycena sanguinolenta]